jgi:hypothetical protein
MKRQNDGEAIAAEMRMKNLKWAERQLRNMAHEERDPELRLLWIRAGMIAADRQRELRDRSRTTRQIIDVQTCEVGLPSDGKPFYDTVVRPDGSKVYYGTFTPKG